MTLEDRVVKLESDMCHLMSGDVKIPKKSTVYDSILRFVSAAPPLALAILCMEIICFTFELGLILGERVESHNARHETPASVNGPVSPPGHDTSEDPR